eukprot:97980-Pyramimonas_sp.AAC.2
MLMVGWCWGVFYLGVGCPPRRLLSDCRMSLNMFVNILLVSVAQLVALVDKCHLLSLSFARDSRISLLGLARL